MPLTKKEVFENWVVIDCAVLGPDYLVFILQQATSHPKFNKSKRPLIKMRTYGLLAEPDDQWHGVSFPDPIWKRPKVVHTELNECLMVDHRGEVFYLGSVGDEDKDFEKSLRKDGGGVSSLKNINGTVYGAYLARTLHKRLDKNQWLTNHEARNFPDYKKIALGGFYDLDGFSENDIYCVGADQDVWHFDSKTWKPLDICDGNFDAISVCCAEDGFVYIGFDDGRIAKGRDDKWCVTEKKDSLRDKINDIVYYRRRVFVGVDRGTYLLNEDLSFTPFDFDGQLSFHGGAHLYTAYDKLLVANMSNQIAFYDGEKWLDINGCE